MNKMLSKEVNFKLAKLLKEKGFKIDTEKILFYKDEINNIEEHQIKNRNLLYKADVQFILGENEYQVYTIGEVIDWLYDRYEIWISVHQYKNTFSWRIVGLEFIDDFKSPIEAYKHAIKYCLENLL